MARLLIYAINYAPELTGSGKYTTELAEWFAAQGHRVEVITSVPHYPQWRVAPEYRHLKFRRERHAGVAVSRTNVYLQENDGNIGAKARILLETSFSFTSIRSWLPIWLGIRKFDAVISVCPPLQMGLFPWLLRQIHRTPWIMHVQDLQVDAALDLNILKLPGAARVLLSIERFLLQRADRVSTITLAMGRRIQAKGVDAGRIWQLPNWSSVEINEQTYPMNSFRMQLGLKDDDLLVLYAGNIGQKQGVEIIPEVARLLNDDSRIHFVVVGEGAMARHLAELKEKYQLVRLTLLPLQPLDQLRMMLTAADLHLVVQKRAAGDLVMPSKLTNILAVGGVTVATAEPGTTLHDVIAGATCGIATEPENPEALAEAIAALASSSAQRETFSANARRYAQENLLKDQVLARFESELLELIARTKS